MKWLVLAALVIALLINWANHRTQSVAQRQGKALVAMCTGNLGYLGALLLWLALTVMLWFVLTARGPGHVF